MESTETLQPPGDASPNLEGFMMGADEEDGMYPHTVFPEDPSAPGVKYPRCIACIERERQREAQALTQSEENQQDQPEASLRMSTIHRFGRLEDTNQVIAPQLSEQSTDSPTSDDNTGLTKH